MCCNVKNICFYQVSCLFNFFIQVHFNSIDELQFKFQCVQKLEHIFTLKKFEKK